MSELEAQLAVLAESPVSVIEALNWLVIHKGCANLQACWDTAPLDIRGVITTAWGCDPFTKDSGWTCAD